MNFTGMNSLDLLKMINKFRKEAGLNQIRNNVFINRIEDELDDLIGYKTFVTNNSGKGGVRTPQKYYDLNDNQCILVGMRESKAVRKKVLIELNKRKNLDTLTHDEVVNLSKRIEAFKYEDNQKLIEKMHKEKYVASGKGNYADFNISRNNVLNIHKDKIDTAIKEYCIKNNRKLPNLKSKHDKIQFIDEHKNLKHAIWDSLEIQNEKHSLKLANLGERMAKALGIKTKRKNENNLFELKENIDIKSLVVAAK